MNESAVCVFVQETTKETVEKRWLCVRACVSGKGERSDRNVYRPVTSVDTTHFTELSVTLKIRNVVIQQACNVLRPDHECG